MAQIVHAARQGDAILHPSLLAELISAAVETVIYAAAALAVTAAIGLAVVGTAFTGGALGVVIGMAAGVAVGAMSSMPVGEDRSIGDAISDFSDSVGNAMSSPKVYGQIESGSENTFINGKAAARAAAISSPNGSDQEAKGEEPSVLENVSAMAQTALGFAFPPLKLVKDLFDTVHQIFNPPVTTPAAPGFTPKEEDKIKCSRHPPMPETYIAQGSDKVLINSRPAARSGDKATCDATIDVNANVSPNVRIGGATVTVRNIHNGKSKTAQIVGIVAALLISRRMAVRSRRSQRAKENNSVICPGVGNPVLVSTGSKVLGGTEDVDFSLPGLLGIEWARSYDSNDSRTDGLLGMGWSVPYEVQIVRVQHPHGGELWIYVDETGNRLELGQLIAGNAFVSVIDGLAFFQLEDGQTVVEDIYEGRYQVFQTDPHNPQRSRLIRLGDRNLNVLDMLYDKQGRLHFLVDKYSQTVVQLHYDQQHTNRVGKVSRVFLHAGDSISIERNKTLASYRYTRSGQLHEVLDATDHVVRRFTYTAEGYLNSHQIASGAIREYEWACFTIPENRPTPKRADGTGYQLPPLLEPQPDHEWRVTRHWGSDGEEYRFKYDLERGETHVTDSLGRQDHYYWGPFYEIYKHIDPLGNCWQEEIIAGQLMKSVDPQGGEWRYSYDDIGRLIETRDPLGRSEHIRYLRHWALPIEVTDGAGRTYRSGYDAQGNLLWEADPLGRKTHYQYDPEGRVVRVTDTLDKTKYLSWNLHGQLLSYRDCSNAQTLYHYDTDGRLCETVNARGEHTHYRYDPRGYLIESERPDGRIDRYDIDAAGQLIAYTDPAQRITRLRYDRSGRLIQRIDALGHTVEFGYDAGMLKTYSYSLCLLLDEVVIRTTWGRLSSWSERSLPSQFHGETQGGEKFFTVMNNMIPEAARYQHVLELMYQCLVSCLKRK
ncbi:DotU family type IV/VI secretion system protein [Pseudomonas sp. PGPPP1]|uniref:DotU family type IV/VI secretion system protein n=2 Tax=Gammaproteobacteria TaxID=1236 RepID=UPI00257C00A6|nr:DotU family type IV/VI secretion system protein [Pseudomonas sp. PGPPP1]